MKKMIFGLFPLLIVWAMISSIFAQEGQQPVQDQVSQETPAAAPVTPAAPVKKKAVRKNAAGKTPAKQPAAVSRVPAPAPAAAAPVPPPAPQVEIATVVPAAVSAATAPVAVRPQACPNCFQPLLAGYNEIIADLKSWMDEMDAQASELDRRLSEIQKRIDEKDDAIEKAKLGPDKKEAKAAVKGLSKERKMILKEYTGANDEKETFYRKFSKEAEKKVEGYNKIAAKKLQMTQSAASQ